MSSHDRRPDADATPLSDDEQATFDALASELAANTSRNPLARLHLRLMTAPVLMRAGVSVVLVALLVAAAAPLAAWSVPAAFLAVIAATAVCAWALPTWRAATTQAAAELARLFSSR